ncbi:leucine-rich repeat protein 1 [Anthonomus grandis grandis]|uniref:leucine-rich repeat protein 1 n=1 Tax=Anthonomus grandis grandis TaxID=2921223 RepID=UPI002166898E|nr:leucine-rich repeat protein 1 [Anthonomus grandis grandis]
MKIHCTVCVVNRLAAHLPASMKKRPVKSTLALCKHPNNNEYSLILFSGQNKNGTKYPLKDNLKHIFARFINDGKCTIQFKKPEHDLCVQGDPIQVKGFLHLLKRAFEGKVASNEFTYSSLNVMPVKQKEVPVTKLEISHRSQYPSKGFPRTLEFLSITNIQRCSLDKGILQLSRLKVLDLTNNLIEHLPEEFGNLPNLKELNLTNNKLGRGALKQWQWLGGALSKSLHALNLCHNEMHYVPDQLVKFHNLSILNLNCNKLKKLPAGMGNLRNLKLFDASNNLLTALPGSIKKWNLQAIDVSANAFVQIIPEANAACPGHLPVCSLKEYAAKRVLEERIPYSKGTIPLNLIGYLDYANYCVCGKACFNIFLTHSHNILLTDISNVVNRKTFETICVPIDCHFCSLKCYHAEVSRRVNRNPIVR